MRKITVNLYKFDELNDKAKERAREWYRQADDGSYRWECIVEDAKEVGLIVRSLDRQRRCEGSFKDGALECAHKIMEQHGESCETYKTAAAFLKERDEIVNSAPKDENGDFVDEYALDQKLDEVEVEFLRNILEDYAINLEKDIEYDNEDAQVDESIRANEYEFTEDGKIA